MSDVNKFEALLSDVSDVIRKFKEGNRLGKKNFTVFTALRNETKEAGTHTTFLYEILRPDGEHGLGSRFLKSFIRDVLRLEVHNDSKTSIHQEYDISKECAISGRVDLVVGIDNMVYPVEIKIFAPDQHEQVERYFKYARRHNSKHDSALPTRVFYLTLDGHKPDSMGNLKQDDDVVCISFADHISKWLETMRNDVPAGFEHVSAVLEQYQKLVAKLTGEMLMDKEIAEKLVARDNFESAVAIARNLKNAKTEILRRFIDGIRAHMRTRLGACYDSENIYGDIESFYKDEKEHWCGVEYVIRETATGNGEPLPLVLAFELSRHLCYGIGISADFCGVIHDDERYPFVARRVRRAYDSDRWGEFIKDYKGKDVWIWQRYFLDREDCKLQSGLDFRDCSGRYLELLDPEGFKKIMDEIFTEVDDNLDSILETGLPRNLDRIEKYI